MNNWMKLGYMLVGAGLGVFAATLMYQHELDKPIGEIEEYVPKSDQEDSENDISSNSKVAEDKKSNTDIQVNEAFAKSDTHILEYYKSDQDDMMGVKNLEERAKKRREDFDKAHSNRNQATRYSHMYEDDVQGMDIEDRLHAQRYANTDWRRREQEKISAESHRGTDEYLKYITASEPDDNPSDDIPYEDDSSDDLVRERVENNFEIYLGENPQDYVPLIFYQGDNTLADDREHIVPAADEVVGLAALSRLIEGGPGAEDGVIYVRNLKTMIDYEIVLDGGSYSETVLGIFNSRQNKGAGGDVNRR